MKEEITNDATEIKKITRDYYEQSYTKNLYDKEEMDKFLETYNLPRLNHEEIENVNRSITSMKIEAVIENLLTKKSPGPDGFAGEFYQTFKEELMPVFLKFFPKN